ncbi:NYN domain-containing protein [Trichothermofontia sichuanensis B231]|uniref:NYN domain-containing protein n=1 Tax=Trichothermofontia sichuanensis TaxID=3045816 RepID=UPI00224734B7|nr:NYN domain-containing protein [Trichothermofontia sichuanensis]UZQ54367.1 NYN domain-containing protein [Trichothermofontia sichuanensis B231]
MVRSSPPQAVLLVDGYNIIGTWPSLQALRDGQNLRSARQQLVNILINYSAFRGYETQLVFDAQYANGTQGRGGHSRHERMTHTLSVHYTKFGETADSYIEKSCSRFRQDMRRFEQRLIVATSDRAQQLTVVGYGAECMSAAQLAADVDLARQQQLSKQGQTRRSPNRLLANHLDPQVRQQLARLRRGDRC